MKTIDVHTHLFPPFYIDLLRSRSEFPRIVERDGAEVFEVAVKGGGLSLTPDFYSVEAKLAFMDRAGVRTSLLSIGNPWLRFIRDAEESRAAAREVNRIYRELVDSEDRFEALGVLPAWNLDLAVAEARRVAEEGVLKGFMSGPTLAGKDINDGSLDPLWEVLSAAQMILMIHPGEVSVEGKGLGLTAAMSFPFETTLAAARLLDEDVPLRFPGIRFLLSHGGGALPFLIARLDHFSTGTGPSRPSEQARAFYTDNLVYQNESLWLVGHVFRPDRVMFGTDHPFTSNRPEPLSTEGMLAPDLTIKALDHANAAQLLAI